MSGLFPAGSEEGAEWGGGQGWGGCQRECGLCHGVIQGSLLPSSSGWLTENVSFLCDSQIHPWLIRRDGAVKGREPSRVAPPSLLEFSLPSFAEVERSSRGDRCAAFPPLWREPLF